MLKSTGLQLFMWRSTQGHALRNYHCTTTSQFLKLAPFLLPITVPIAIGNLRMISWKQLVDSGYLQLHYILVSIKWQARHWPKSVHMLLLLLVPNSSVRNLDSHLGLQKPVVSKIHNIVLLNPINSFDTIFVMLWSEARSRRRSTSTVA